MSTRRVRRRDIGRIVTPRRSAAVKALALPVLMRHCATRPVEQLTEATQDFIGSGKHVQAGAERFGPQPRGSRPGLLSWFFGEPRILVATDTDLQLLDGRLGRVVGDRSAPRACSADLRPGHRCSARPRAVLSRQGALPRPARRSDLHRVHFDQIRRIDGEVGRGLRPPCCGRAAYPGSFDPLTIAHLGIAEAAREHHDLDRVDLVISVRRPGQGGQGRRPPRRAGGLPGAGRRRPGRGWAWS